MAGVWEIGKMDEGRKTLRSRLHKFRQLLLRDVKISTKFDFWKKSVILPELYRSCIGVGSEADYSSFSEYPSCGDVPIFLGKALHSVS